MAQSQTAPQDPSMTTNTQRPELDLKSLKGTYHALVVSRIIEETELARSIVFHIPPHLEAAFTYKAGQFLTLRIPFEGKLLVRCYSLASSPHCDSEYKVTIKRVLNGRISNWINDQLKVGDTVEVLPPAGLFCLGEVHRNVLLFGGGSGITPVMSILKTALVTTQRHLKLVYANRDEASVIFKKELDELQAKYPDRLDIVNLYDVVHGFLTKDKVKELVGDNHGAEFFVCGPGPFMDIVEAALLELEVDTARIHIERFISPPDPVSANEPQPTLPPLPEGAEVPASVCVVLKGKTHQVPYQAGDSILRATLRAGLDAPYACQEGFCGCCMAKVTEGSVQMGVQDVLSEQQVKEGWVLTCQSRPTSKTCAVKFDE